MCKIIWLLIIMNLIIIYKYSNIFFHKPSPSLSVSHDYTKFCIKNPTQASIWKMSPNYLGNLPHFYWKTISVKQHWSFLQVIKMLAYSEFHCIKKLYFRKHLQCVFEYHVYVSIGCWRYHAALTQCWKWDRAAVLTWLIKRSLLQSSFPLKSIGLAVNSLGAEAGLKCPSVTAARAWATYIFMMPVSQEWSTSSRSFSFL